MLRQAQWLWVLLPSLTFAEEGSSELSSVQVVEIARAGVCDGRALKPPTLPDGVSYSTLDDSTQADEVERALGGGMLSLPMWIAYDGDRELDRMCGCQLSVDLQLWARELKSGQTWASLAEMALSSNGYDFEGKMEVIKRHRCANRTSEVMNGLVSMWMDIPKQAPLLLEERSQTIAPMMAEVVKGSKQAYAQARAIRDMTRMRGLEDSSRLRDWVALNGVLNADAETLEWYRQQDPATNPMLSELWVDFYSVYARQQEWAKAGSLIQDPDALQKEWLALGRDGVKKSAQVVYALRAADRGSDSRRLERKLLEAQGDSAACVLLQTAVKMQQVGAEQKWLTKRCDQQHVVTSWQTVFSAQN